MSENFGFLLNESTSITDFTDEEIKEQLRTLGFKNISQDKFKQFKKDLEKLIASEVSLNNSSSTLNTSAQTTARTETAKNGVEKNTVHNNNNNKKVTFPSDSQIARSSHNHFASNNTSNDENDEDEGDLNESFASSVMTETSSVCGNRVIKRKVVRKVKHNSKTNSSKNTNNKTSLDDEFQRKMNIKSSNDDDSRHSDNDEPTLTEKELELNYDEEDDGEEFDMIQFNEHYAPINYPVKSFIRPTSAALSSARSDYSSRLHSSRSTASTMMSQYRSSVSVNPAQRYREYKKLWDVQKQPGEKRHANLRWSIRGQMLEKQVYVRKQHRVQGPNTYVVPTEKKRDRLRWIVRNSLANPTY